MLTQAQRKKYHEQQAQKNRKQKLKSMKVKFILIAGVAIVATGLLVYFLFN